MRTRLRRAPALLLAAVLGILGMLVVATPAAATPGVIDGYVYEEDGTTPIEGALVVFDDGSVPYDFQFTTTDPSGYYAFTPPAGWDDEDFYVAVYGGEDHLDGYITGHYVSSDHTTGEVPDFLLGPGRRITGVVRDAATGLPLDDVLIIALDENGDEAFVSALPTGPTGEYTIGVSPGQEYVLMAIRIPLDYDMQFWDHINFTSYRFSCSCLLPDFIDVPGLGAPITGIDFDLYGLDDWIYFSVFAEDENGDEQPGVTIHLDKRTGPSTYKTDGGC